MDAGELLTLLRSTLADTGAFELVGPLEEAYGPLWDGLGLPRIIPLASAEGWVQSGEVVSLTGTAGTDLFAVPEAPVYLQFTSAGQAGWTLLLDVGLPASWTFGQSFAMLAAGVFQDLHPADGSGSALVVASGPATDPLREGGGAPIGVSAPLTFTGIFDVNSSGWSQIAWLAGGGGRVTGPVAYDDATGAVSMDIPLASGGVAHVLGSSGPPLRLALALYSGYEAGLGQYLFGVRFEAEVDFETQEGTRSLRLTALRTLPSQSIVDLTASGSAFAFPTPAALARWFGSRHGLPERLPEGFQDGTLLQVTALTLGVGLQSRRLEYAFLVLGALQGVEWEIWPQLFTLTDIDATFAAMQPLSDRPVYALTVGGTVAFGGVPVRAEVSVPEMRFSGELLPLAPPAPLAGLVQAVLGTDAGIPDTLWVDELAFAAALPVGGGAGAYSFEVEVAGKWAFAFGESNLVVFERLRAQAAYTPDGVSAALQGAFRVGRNEFELEADLAAANLVFRGVWKDGGEPLGYQDLAMALGMYGLPTPPQYLDLRFTAASFEFETAGPTFSFTIDTAEYGRGAMIAGRGADGRWGFVFGMEAALALELPLTDIPVVGDLVPAGMDVIALDDLRIVGATAALPLYTPTEDLDRVLGPVIASGLVLSIGLRVGTTYAHAFSVRFGGADDDSALDVPPPPLQLPGSAPGFAVTPPGPLVLAAGPAPATAAPGPQYSWVDVQRAFGPVQFGRIGFAVTPEDRLALALDGSVALAGLTLALTGLSAEIPLEPPYLPTFDLAGLAVEYAAAGLEIGGALVKVPGAEAPVYTGELVLEVERFGALALGSYSRVGGSPSLFAFVLLDVPLGGPGFFFVTGLAGGFGFNRALQLPTIDTVATYPLVQGAMGTLDARSTAAALEQYIRPAANQQWFAAGIRFTSYGMLRSYVLATLSFGATVEVGLMGESTLALPPVGGEGEAIAPLAEADLVLLVDVVPASGVLAVAAQLSPASYVLSRQARLTGGFALCLWFPPSPHAGDFVVSLGGYNPYFEVPAHYPAVPRLGFSWTLSTELSLEGGLYCALTPAVVMAGGSLRASWRGGGLTAWLTADADFVMRLRPFSYSVDVAVAIGVSYVLDLGITKRTVSVQLSGALAMWGQPFGGTAWVDASVLSFTFSFGAPRSPAAAELDWAAFRDAFLPPVQPSAPAPAAAAAARALTPERGGEATPTAALVAIHAAAGLRGTYESGGDVVWRVDPSALRIVVATQVPSKTLTLSPRPEPALAGGWNTAFGVGPMGAAPAEVSVALTVSVTREGAPDGDGWSAGAVLGNVPAGVWLSTTADLGAEPVVAGVLTGVELVPRTPVPDSTLPVPVQALLGGDAPVVPIAWETAAAPTSDPFDQGDAMQQLQRTLTDPAVAATRSAILGSLRRQGVRTAASVDVSRFAAQAPELLTAPPQLRLLGETPAA